MVHEPDGTAVVLQTAIDSVRFTDGLHKSRSFSSVGEHAPDERT